MKEAVAIIGTIVICVFIIVVIKKYGDYLDKWKYGKDENDNT